MKPTYEFRETEYHQKTGDISNATEQVRYFFVSLPILIVKGAEMPVSGKPRYVI